MKTCIITCSYHSHIFDTKFPIEKSVPEYVLADEAWRIALLFAQTQAIANTTSVSKVLADLDYDYIIKED